MSVEDLFLNSKKKIPMVTNSSHPKRNSCRGIIKHLNSTSRNSWGLGTHLWDIGVKPFIAMVPKLGGVRVTLLDTPGWKLIHGPLVKGDEPILGFCIIFKWKDVSFRGVYVYFFPSCLWNLSWVFKNDGNLHPMVESNKNPQESGGQDQFSDLDLNWSRLWLVLLRNKGWRVCFRCLKRKKSFFSFF